MKNSGGSIQVEYGRERCQSHNLAEEVKRMARSHGFQMRLIPMSNTHHATMEELVIGKDLSWMDRFPAVHESKAEYIIRETKKKYRPQGGKRIR